MPTSAARQIEVPGEGLQRAPEITEPIGAYVVYGTRKTKRNYGFHPFPGRKDSNVIQTYILHHTRKSDLVLDVFAGSGTTAREALILKRRALVVDINPVMRLITRASVLPVNISELLAAFRRVEAGVRRDILSIEKMDSSEIEGRIAQHNLDFLDREIPRVIRRGKRRGFFRLRDLHDPRQTLGLLLLREAVEEEADDRLRLMLQLAFSHSLKYANMMYSAGPNRSYWAGNSSVFRSLAYQVPTHWDYKNVWDIFEKRSSFCRAALHIYLSYWREQGCRLATSLIMRSQTLHMLKLSNIH
jgi:hypothetical protein